MHWLVKNINHITVPLGMLLASFSVVVGFTTQRRRRQGLTGPVFSDRVRNISFVVILISCVLLGIALARNWG